MTAHHFNLLKPVVLGCFIAAGAWPDDPPTRLPERYAEAVLNVEGMT